MSHLESDLIFFGSTATPTYIYTHSLVTVLLSFPFKNHLDIPTFLSNRSVTQKAKTVRKMSPTLDIGQIYPHQRTR